MVNEWLPPWQTSQSSSKAGRWRGSQTGQCGYKHSNTTRYIKVWRSEPSVSSYNRGLSKAGIIVSQCLKQYLLLLTDIEAQDGKQIMKIGSFSSMAPFPLTNPMCSILLWTSNGTYLHNNKLSILYLFLMIPEVSYQWVEKKGRKGLGSNSYSLCSGKWKSPSSLQYWKYFLPHKVFEEKIEEKPVTDHSFSLHVLSSYALSCTSKYLFAFKTYRSLTKASCIQPQKCL